MPRAARARARGSGAALTLGVAQDTRAAAIPNTGSGHERAGAAAGGGRTGIGRVVEAVMKTGKEYGPGVRRAAPRIPPVLSGHVSSLLRTNWTRQGVRCQGALCRATPIAV